jgi:protein-tyrosine phosphatase
MGSEIYWIEGTSAGRLAIMARPRAGDWLRDEIAGWAGDRIDTVVSLLQPDEVKELELGDEAAICLECGIELISFPIPDRGVPASLRDAIDLARQLAKRINEQKSIAVHCRAGIGRSAVVAACIMAVLGTEPEAALERISDARRLKVPDTDEQRRWVRRFRDALRSSEEHTY